MWPLSIKVTAKKFHKLHESQRRDLILYFYERESAKTKLNSRPPYKFHLEKLRDYFGRSHDKIRDAVLDSDEYKAYAEERSRPPPPPEMSPDKCDELDLPLQEDEASGAAAFDRAALLPASAAPFGAAAGTKRAAPDSDLAQERSRPGAAARGDVAGEAASGASPVQPPQSQGEPLLPVV